MEWQTFLKISLNSSWIESIQICNHNSTFCLVQWAHICDIIIISLTSSTTMTPATPLHLLYICICNLIRCIMDFFCFYWQLMNHNIHILHTPTHTPTLPHTPTYILSVVSMININYLFSKNVWHYCTYCIRT